MEPESTKNPESKRDNETNQDSAKNKSRIPFNWKLADYFFRVLVVGVILYLCWGLVSGVIFSDRKTPEQNEVNVTPDAGSLAKSNTDNAAPHMFMSDFMKGNWTFGGADWEFNSRDMMQLPDDEVMDQAPSKLRGYDSRFEDKKILDIFRGLGAKKKATGQVNVWHLSRGSIRARLFTSQSSQGEIVQLVRIAFPKNHKISLMEGAPLDSLSVRPVKPLLPLNDNMEQIATRTNEDGVVSSAIIEFVPGEIDIREFWNQNGWQVRADTTAGFQSTTQFRCVKDNIVVIATFVPDPSSEKTSILLVRVPDSSQ